MALSINTNLASLSAQSNVAKTQTSLEKALERLSSGLRINSAKDDAAGLAISNRMTAQVNGLNQAVSNANDGISLAQTAEGALDEVTTNLQRLRELAVQAANASNSDDDRAALQEEASQLLDAIDSIANDTEFNGITLLDGSFTSQKFQVGANSGQTLTVSMGSAKTSDLGTDSTASLTAQGSDTAINEGDLIINGTTIRSSSASDDTASYPASSKASSAIAKAAAINASSSETGVTATADENVLEGAYMSGAAGSGTLTINGVDITITTTDDASASRTSVVEAINAVSGQTGVVAADTGSDATGVTLTAADGRNITVQFGSPTTGVFDASSTGITGLSSNELAGTSMTGATGTGYIQINGVDTGLIETTTDTAETRANVVAAINAISDKTGVVAVDTGDDSKGITLTASDGRHIGTQLMSVSGTFSESSTGVNVVQATGSGAAAAGSNATAYDFQINGVTVDFTTAATATAADTASKIVSAVNGNSDLQAMGIVASVDASNVLTFTSTNGTALDFTAGSYTLANLGVADTNSTTGGTMTAATNSTTYDFQLNDQTISWTTDASATAAESAQAVVDAITANSTLSGQGITAELNAAGDGFVVHSTQGAAITFTDGSADRAALGAIADKTAADVASGEASTTASTDYGSYTLTSSSDIVISSGSGSASDLAAIGLVSGTYDSQTAYASSSSNNGIAIGEGDVKINGVLIGASTASSDTYSRYSSTVDSTEAEQLTAASAIAKVAAINAISDQTKVTATVNENVSDGADMTGGDAGTGKLVINGVETSVIGVADVTDATSASENRAAVISAINAISDQTGVTAEDTNDITGGIRLVAADGRNINVEFEDGLNSANTGVSGSTVTQSLTGTTTYAGAATSGTITINGYETGTVTTLAADSAAVAQGKVVDAINSISDKTGVTAEISGGNVKLTSVNGVGFDLSYTGLTAATSGLAASGSSVSGTSETTFGTYTLTSTSSFEVEKGTTASLENSGLAVGTYGSGKSGMALSDIDLSTAEGASNAIDAIDNALKQIDSSRSTLGAVQNRFEATISNLSNVSENLTAASSRITDADFAAETANMTKYQVLQQAGVAVLAQANSLPQQLLSLLK